MKVYTNTYIYRHVCTNISTRIKYVNIKLYTYVLRVNIFNQIYTYGIFQIYI